LPHKFHPLQHIQQTYPQPYLHLITNQHTTPTFINPTKIIQQITNYLNQTPYLQLQTPIIHQIPPAPPPPPFLTHHNPLHPTLYIPIAIQLHLKPLIVRA
ncbi:amino acid--tRNA ligase-related protein, partial [Staphylococcus hominis]|uniref:amino acid--tRNA ligase-related protein n=1 Tax=Staphylococcus hominis TaxID=1290 RepID=UPI0028CB93B1